MRWRIEKRATRLFMFLAIFLVSTVCLNRSPAWGEENVSQPSSSTGNQGEASLSVSDNEVIEVYDLVPSSDRPVSETDNVSTEVVEITPLPTPSPPTVERVDLRYVTLPPDSLQRVRLSSTDVNRVVCNAGEIVDVVYSKEKGLITKISGGNIFLKFQVFEQEGQLVYSSNPVEIYLTCGEAVYSMIADPVRIPSVTVTLADRSDRFKENAVLFTGLALEEKLSKLIKYAYMDEIPNSFEVTDGVPDNSSYLKNLPGLDARLRRTIRVEGEGLMLMEYFIFPREDVEVREVNFMSFVARPAAVALDSTKMKKGGRYRLFVVGYSLSHSHWQGGL